MKLIISEKPSVGKTIADVIGATEKKDGYYEGDNYIVSWCVGHLVELAQPQEYNAVYERWTYDTLPIVPDEWKYSIKPDTKAQYKVLRELMHRRDVEAVVCATDAGREGELIFRLVYNMAGCSKPIERLWISSMEDSAIRDGMNNLKPGSEYDRLYKAALARQEADWLVGINGTRLFTVLYGGKTLKVGRVQTPTLAMLVDREAEIGSFKKKQYFIDHILIKTQVKPGVYEAIDAISDRIDTRADADNLLAKCKGNTAVVTSIVREDKKMSIPKLYDLTSLQRDANKIFGFTAKKTLDHTQTLYERKLVTYPRTDSRFLTDDMENTAKVVIAAIKRSIPFMPGVSYDPNIKPVMNSKKVSDHHAIIPTVEIANADLNTLSEDEKKVLYLIAARLLEATAVPYLFTTQKVVFECGGSEFTAKGKVVRDIGWKIFEEALKEVYKTSKDSDDESSVEQKLPDVKDGEVFDNIDGKISEHFTKPPARYTEASLLTAMEKAGSEDMDDDVERKGLGTPATRADIIEKLVKDGFIKREKKNLIPTENGIKLITVLPDKVKSAKLTAEWENFLSLVAKGEAEYDDFISDITDMVEELVNTYSQVREEDKKLFSNTEVLGKCPNCGADIVKGKFGAYCKSKCGMMLGKIMGVKATDAQIKALLAGKKVFIKGIKKKSGDGTYDAYLTPEEIVDCSYTRDDGTEIKGKQFKYKMEFPKRK
ncbi:MAG: DNA topoisomerase 3 [Eubacterium sp.]|nr:DNA topoisomerase 3 [Eubacterium sp.]